MDRAANKIECHAITNGSKNQNSYVASWFPLAGNERSYQISAGKINIFIYYDVDNVMAIWEMLTRLLFGWRHAIAMKSIFEIHSTWISAFRTTKSKSTETYTYEIIWCMQNEISTRNKYHRIFVHENFSHLNSKWNEKIIIDTNESCTFAAIKRSNWKLLPNRCDYLIQSIRNRWLRYLFNPIRFPCYRSAFQV